MSPSGSTRDADLRTLLDRVLARTLDPLSAADELYSTHYATK